MFWLFGLGLACLSFLLARIMLRTAVQIEMIDTPNARSSHSTNVPKGGGLVFSALYTAFLLYLYVFEPNFKFHITAFLIMTPALFALGWLDDRLKLSASFRLMVQFFLSGAVLFSLTNGFRDFFQVIFLPDWPILTMAFLFLYIVWFVNLYNFMDGADGIAGGGGMIAAFVLAFICYWQSAELLGGLYFFLGCSLVGFVLYNWSPARFFMGDSGAYYLGGAFVVFSIAGRAYEGVSLYPTIIIFGLFIVDATFTLCMRVAQGFKPFTPHQVFGFHKLFKRGWSHGQAALLYLGIMGLWLAPLAFLTVIFPSMSVILLIIAYGPLLAFEVYIKAGKG